MTISDVDFATSTIQLPASSRPSACSLLMFLASPETLARLASRLNSAWFFWFMFQYRHAFSIGRDGGRVPSAWRIYVYAVCSRPSWRASFALSTQALPTLTLVAPVVCESSNSSTSDSMHRRSDRICSLLR